MNELIKIENREGIETVNARDLHKGLESKQDFSTWIKSRLEGFIENQDFTLHKFVEGKATKIDYYITLDTAKHVAMLERNEQGKQIRQYFIEVENRAKQIHAKIPTGTELLALAVIEAQKQLQAKDEIIESMKPAVQFMADVTGSRDAIEMSQAAKIIGMGYGRNKLFELLRDNGVLRDNNEPYQKYIDAKWFRMIEQKWIDSKGETHISIKTLIYQKGIDGIIKLIRAIDK